MLVVVNRRDHPARINLEPRRAKQPLVSLRRSVDAEINSRIGGNPSRINFPRGGYSSFATFIARKIAGGEDNVRRHALARPVKLDGHSLPSFPLLFVPARRKVGGTGGDGLIFRRRERQPEVKRKPRQPSCQ